MATSSSFGPSDTWNKDICPYATFQMPAEAEANEKVTITLQHHGQLENNFASNETTYHHRHQLDFSGETFRIKPVRFIFKGLEEIMRIYCRLESCAKCPWGTTSTLRLLLSIRKGRDEKQ